MKTEDIVVILLFGGPVLLGILYTITSAWKKVRIAEQNAVLTKEMLDRGFSSDEIVRVLEVSGTRGEEPQDVGSALVENGYSSDDIVAVTNSYERCPQAVKTNIRSSVVKMIESGYKGRKIVAYIDSRCASSVDRPDREPANV